MINDDDERFQAAISRAIIVRFAKFLEFWNPLIKSYQVATRNALKTRFSDRDTVGCLHK